MALCSTCSLGSCALYTLSKQEILAMESQAHQTKFKKGEILRKQDSPLDSIIYLRNGFVKEYLAHGSNADQVIQIIKPRSYIGLQELCTNKISFCSYQAITDVEVCYIEKEILCSLVRQNGNFAREILIALSLESLSNQKRFLDLNQTQIFGKVAGLIIYLSEEVYENSEFDVFLKREELANMVASTRESVTRALKWFHNENIIFLSKTKFKILNEDRLYEIAKKG